MKNEIKKQQIYLNMYKNAMNLKLNCKFIEIIILCRIIDDDKKF